MLTYFWLVSVFVIGTAVGSFLNVAIARLPFEKNLLWPGSRCGKCFQSIRWFDNIPLLSYLWLRGRCRSCGERFSISYLGWELFTGLGYAGLFYLEVMVNIHNWPGHDGWWVAQGVYPWHFWAGYISHVLLFTFLVAASGCDLNGRIIPFPITFTGTLVGLVSAVLFPWPWPHPPQAGVIVPRGLIPIGDAWMMTLLPEGVCPWPVWGPLPLWLFPPESWQLGLATGLAGMLMGTFLLRTVGGLFSAGLGKEGLGMGDADLMMMVGAFLGWQIVVVAFFVSVLPALFIGIFQMLVRRDNSLPFGPSLAAGTMISLLCWSSIGSQVQILFFWGNLMLILAGMCAVMLLVCGVMMRLLRMLATRT